MKGSRSWKRGGGRAKGTLKDVWNGSKDGGIGGGAGGGFAVRRSRECVSHTGYLSVNRKESEVRKEKEKSELSD